MLFVTPALAFSIALVVFPVFVSAAQTRTLAWPSEWKSPLSSSTVVVTANYGALSKGCPNHDASHHYTFYLDTGREEHLGLDLRAGKRTSVYAMGDGRVIAAGNLWGKKWGGAVLVEHHATNGEGFTVVYGHVDVGKSPLRRTQWRAGDLVRRGDTIGVVANIHPYPAHLHIGVAPRVVTKMPGFSLSGGTGKCASKREGTVDPVAYLGRRKHAPVEGSIVGWKNRDGSVTSWQVTNVGGKLHRYWIPDTKVYGCVKKKGGIDRGPMPAAFLDQIPDRTGHHASC